MVVQNIVYQKASEKARDGTSFVSSIQKNATYFMEHAEVAAAAMDWHRIDKARNSMV